MLLTADVGNTEIVLGVFEGAELRHTWRSSTQPERTSDELALLLAGFLEHRGLDLRKDITGMCIASVVPDVTGQFREMAAAYLTHEPVIVGPGMKTGVSVVTDNPREVGADRVVNTLAAFTAFGGPAIVVDFGTSTNFDVVSDSGEFLGGVIAPGLQISASALVGRTARLTRVDLQPPRSPVGRSTVEAIQSGLDLRHRRRGRRHRRADPRRPRRARCDGGRDRRPRTGRDPALPDRRSLRALAHPRGAQARLREEHRCLRSRPGREAEVLAARRESLERLGNRRAFAITLADVLDVSEPTRSGAVRAAHPDLAADTQTEDVVTVAGRVVLKRDMGKLVFATLRDPDGDLQIVVNAANLPADDFALFQEVDLGDIIGATGTVGTTRKGELSVFVTRWAMLTKALRPLPEKWAACKDPDLQQRRRYLHLITDEEPRELFFARAAVLRTIRRVLDERGFVEFEGPMLQTIAGGANARPFTTHHFALDMPMKLRISLELYLKRMLVGGVERIFELGRNFRNEGIDRDHNPEFTMLEAYQAYGDYHTMMELSETLVRESAAP